MAHKSRVLELMRAGSSDPWAEAGPRGGTKGGGDSMMQYYMAQQAASQQAQSSKDVTNMQTWANRPTQITPWGRQDWAPSKDVDPATGQDVTKWTGTTTLTPEEQQALDSQRNIQQGRSEGAETLLGQAVGGFQKPFDWSGMPQAPTSVGGAQQGAFEKMSAMLQPGRQQQQSGLDTKLANMGLPRDSEAWRRANAGLSDQWAQQDKGLLAQALGEGRADVASQSQLRQQGIAEEAQRRGMTLNELNALLTGQQVSMPQMPDFKGAQASQPLQALSAQQIGQNQQQRPGTDWGSAIGGIASVASMFSDRRLKKDIVPLGDGWYAFEYVWGGGRRVGVMAQEVLLTNPGAVSMHPSGYLMVDYGRL